MNKHTNYVALIGLLAVLLIPGMSQAQVVQAAERGGGKIAQFFKGGGTRNLGQKVTLAMQAAALENATSAVKYTPDPVLNIRI